jgi:hypothetical protein
VIVEIELPAETARHHQLQKDEPDAAREQESRQFAFRFLAQCKICARPREQEENGRAEVGNPARKK